MCRLSSSVQSGLQRFHCPGPQMTAATQDIRSEIKARSGRGRQSSPQNICPQLSLARAVSAAIVGYKNAWGKDEDLTILPPGEGGQR